MDIFDFARKLAEAHLTDPELNKRLRIVVTPFEYHKIREDMLAKYGKFYGRVLNIVLVVDDSAEQESDLWVEFPEGKK